MALSLLSSISKAKSRALIYFIPGNPGLIEYYTPFLSSLRNLVNGAESQQTAYDIYGRNLLGFVDEEHEPFGPGREPWDLNGQIEGIGQDVASRRCPDGRPYDKVILMGHSVGAYIAVEIFSRHTSNLDRNPHLNMEHGFLLFPTLTSIALSPSGKRAGTLLAVPGLKPYAHILAKQFLNLFPAFALRYIVGKVTGFGRAALETTLQWLSSKDGVWQAIHLAKTEFAEITEEKWDESMWQGDGVPRFFIFYGKNDHWVDNDIRADFIQRRAAGKGTPAHIEVDKGNIQHAFCTQDGMCKPDLKY